MSQAGIVDIEGANPQIPTSFDTDSGTAIPLANILEVFGDTVSNATFSEPVWTTASGNTVEINIQVGAAITGAPADNNDAGLVSFDDTVFDVDANGYVTLIGGGSAIDSIAVQAGTSPVVPDGTGMVTINGSIVVAGNTPIQSNGTGANTLAIEVQLSQALGASDSTKVGLCNFDSAAFDVDASGFVTLLGGGEAIDSFTPDAGTDPVVPDANGNIVMAGTANQVTTTGGLNSLTFSLPQDIATTSSVNFGNVTLATGGALRTGTTASDTLLFQAYDNNTGPAYVTFATMTAGNTPTMQFTPSLGSSAAPTYSFFNDTDTGMYSSGADVVRIAVGSTDKISFSGISTTILQGSFSTTTGVQNNLLGSIAWTRTATAISAATATGSHIMAVTDTSAVRTITLTAPSSGAVQIIVKDESGAAATNNILVVASAGGTIDGAASVSIATNWGAKTFYYVGTANWVTI